MGRRYDSSSSSSSDSDCETEKKSKQSKSKTKSKHRRRRATKQFDWVWLIPFFGLWLAVFYGVVVWQANNLPTALTIANETMNKGKFIGERAEQILTQYEAIGPKVTGSKANEERTVNLILGEINKTIAVINDQNKIEVDVQQVSGAFIHWEMLNMYQGVQNIAVKLSNKASNSTSYVLINTHFDSKAGSPGSGDPGAMLVVMLEVLRVLAVNPAAINHPILFLFNGAEENPLQGSHGFITQHKWAKNCKVLINLDSAGSGNREIVFQSGPANPWIMKYYKDYAVHPYASSLAEELFQMNIIQSGTDFRIFNKYGPIYGLDMAHTYNGYTYHTKYDKMDVIPRENLQNTGDNILSLAKGFANSPILANTTAYAAGTTVFYDLLGKYLVLYTKDMSLQINYGVSLAALVAVFISISAISARTKVTFVGVLGRLILTFIVHLIGLALGVGLTVGLGYYVDILGAPLSWFTFKWAVIGLYFCPFIFGYGIPTAILVSLMRKDKLNLSMRVQLILNSHLIIMALLSAYVTNYGLKSAYIIMLATLFYTLSLIFNTITTMYRQRLSWVWVVILFQLPNFIYSTYIGYIFFSTLMPMMGGYGTTTNPDLYISGLSALIGLLSLGFVIPLVNLFKRSKTALLLILAIAAGFVAFALSPYGFPFRPATNPERITTIQVRRVFREYDQSVSKNESGYYFYLQDRLNLTTVTSAVNVSKVIPMASQCSQYMFCGLPVFNNGWNRVKTLAPWLPSANATLPNPLPVLTLLSKKTLTDGTIRFDFSLTGPTHIGIFIGPLPGVNVTDWSFLNTMLVDDWVPPYFIYFTKGKDQSTLKFYITLERPVQVSPKPIVEIGIGGHYINNEYERAADHVAFIKSFPAFTSVMEWQASYEKWMY